MLSVNSQPRVLCISSDMVVSTTRCAALKDAGYAVTGTTRVREALDLLSHGQFHLVIVGHRFSTEDKYVLTVEAKEKGTIPVLLVCGASADTQIPAARRVYAVEGTAGLVVAVSALLASGGDASQAA